MILNFNFFSINNREIGSEIEMKGSASTSLMKILTSKKPLSASANQNHTDVQSDNHDKKDL